MLNQFDFVCISLNNRSDRRDKIKETLHQLGIHKRINWWIVDKHKRGGIYGCFESHWSVWNCSEFKRPYLCVFEDDIKVAPGAKAKFISALEKAQEYLPIYFDIVNLEPDLGYVDFQVDTNLFAGFFVHLGCYIMHRSFLPIISERVFRSFGTDIDGALHKQCRMLGYLPKFFEQDLNDTDNGGGYRSILPSIKILYPIARKIKELSPLSSKIAMEILYLWIQYYRSCNLGPFDLQDRRVHKPITEPTESQVRI